MRGVLGRLAPWLRCENVAALAERSVRIPGQYLPRSNDFRAREVGSGSSRHLTRRSYLAAVQQVGLLWRILRSFYRCRSPSSVARSHFAKLASVS